MKNTSNDARPTLFSIPEDGSTLKREDLPSFPAFPVGRDGSCIRVAVPALLIVPVDAFSQECQEQSVADAIEIVTKSTVSLSGVPVECVCLAEKYPTSSSLTASARSRLLSLLSATAQAWAAEAVTLSGQRGAEDARQAGDEILALLAMFQTDGLHMAAESIA